MAGPTTAATPGRARTRGVVIGASMAGLAAARVLAAHLDDVVVVERDQLDDDVPHRQGVPQSRQVHVLLARGLRLLETLFPGYRDEVRRAGGVDVNLPRDALVLGAFGWVTRDVPGLDMLSASRPLLERVARRRVRSLPNVTIADGHEVTGLLTHRRAVRVAGVTVRSRSGGGSEDLPSDLVVDASGRGSKALRWLEPFGTTVPPDTLVDPDIAYASRIYRAPADVQDDWRLLVLSSQPPTMPRSGYLLPIEDGRWIVGLMGGGGQHPPTDDDGYRAFARSLRHPVLADAIDRGEPLTPVRRHRGTANRLRHLDRARHWPDRFVVLGDAACAFNPIYGQGMTTAAIGAETLDGMLRRHGPRGPDGTALRFQRRLARANRHAWLLSTGEDLRFPTTTGQERSAALRALHGYLDRVASAATADRAVADRYIRVIGMLDGPVTLFAPTVLAAAARSRPDRTVAVGAPPRRPDRGVPEYAA